MEDQTITSTEEIPTDPLIVSLNVLIKATMIGQQNGSYTLNEANTIFESIKLIEQKFGKKNEESNQNFQKEVKSHNLSKIDE